MVYWLSKVQLFKAFFLQCNEFFGRKFKSDPVIQLIDNSFGGKPVEMA